MGKLSSEILAWAGGYLTSAGEDSESCQRVGRFMAHVAEVNIDFPPLPEPTAEDFQRAAEFLHVRAQRRHVAPRGASEQLVLVAEWCDDEARRRRRPAG